MTTPKSLAKEENSMRSILPETSKKREGFAFALVKEPVPLA
jgi:hypothetical protein